jgi:hypothetical protein
VNALGDKIDAVKKNRNVMADLRYLGMSKF